MEEKTIYLAHHGVKGMKWGVRRYQNTDGSLTSAGRNHYGIKTKRKEKIKKGLKAVAVGAGVAGGVAAGRTVAKNRKYDKSKPFKERPMLERNIKRGKGKEDESPAEQFTRESSKTIGNTRDAYKAIKGAYKKAEIQEAQAKQMRKVKSMSDEELRRRINRLELEKRYVNLSSPSYGEGRDRVEDVLDIAEPVAGILGSAAIIGTTGYKLYKAKKGL